MGYQCESCEGERPVSVLITPLSGGQTMASCGECMPITLAGLLGAMTGVDPNSIYDYVQSQQAAQLAAETAQAAQDGAAEQLPKRQPGASGKRPVRPSRQAARTAKAAAPAADSAEPGAAGGDPS